MLGYRYGIVESDDTCLGHWYWSSKNWEKESCKDKDGIAAHDWRMWVPDCLTPTMKR